MRRTAIIALFALSAVGAAPALAEGTAVDRDRALADAGRGSVSAAIERLLRNDEGAEPEPETTVPTFEDCRLPVPAASSAA